MADNPTLAQARPDPIPPATEVMRVAAADEEPVDHLLKASRHRQ
jgi:hypothetical protein